MITDEYGNCLFTTKETLDLIYSGESVDQMMLKDQSETIRYNENAKHFDIEQIVQPMQIDMPADEYHKLLSNTWIIPKEYQQLDINEYLAKQLSQHKLSSDEYVERMIQELDEYSSRNMIDILKYLIYMMDVCKQNNIVTGIGRGSSVSSLVLYLIGTHHIDPVKYSLSYKEFLR